MVFGPDTASGSVPGYFANPSAPAWATTPACSALPPDTPMPPMITLTLSLCDPFVDVRQTAVQISRSHPQTCHV